MLTELINRTVNLVKPKLIKHFKVDHSIPGQDELAEAMITLFDLTSTEVDQMYTLFCRIDKYNTGIVSRREFLRYLELEAAIFETHIFNVFDGSDAGDMLFHDFIVLLYSFLTLPERELRILTFLIKDPTGENEITMSDVKSILAIIHGKKSIEKDPPLLTMVIQLQKAVKSNINLRTYMRWSSAFETFVHPLVALQVRLQRKLFGEKFWNDLGQRRHENHELSNLLELRNTVHHTILMVKQWQYQQVMDEQERQRLERVGRGKTGDHRDYPTRKKSLILRYFNMNQVHYGTEKQRPEQGVYLTAGGAHTVTEIKIDSSAPPRSRTDDSDSETDKDEEDEVIELPIKKKKSRISKEAANHAIETAIESATARQREFREQQFVGNIADDGHVGNSSESLDPLRQSKSRQYRKNGGLSPFDLTEQGTPDGLVLDASFVQMTELERMRMRREKKAKEELSRRRKTFDAIHGEEERSRKLKARMSRSKVSPVVSDNRSKLSSSSRHGGSEIESEGEVGGEWGAAEMSSDNGIRCTTASRRDKSQRHTYDGSERLGERDRSLSLSHEQPKKSAKHLNSQHQPHAQPADRSSRSSRESRGSRGSRGSEGNSVGEGSKERAKGIRMVSNSSNHTLAVSSGEKLKRSAERERGEPSVERHVQWRDDDSGALQQQKGGVTAAGAGVGTISEGGGGSHVDQQNRKQQARVKRRALSSFSEIAQRSEK